MFEINELVKATHGKLIAGKRSSPVKGISIDSRVIKEGEAFIAIRGDNFDGHYFIKKAVEKGAGCIIAERRISASGSVPFIRVENTTEALGSIAQFNRNRYATLVIAVTGSNGKTTTKDMIARVLSSNFKVLKNEGTRNNHIGLPLTLLKLDKSYDIAVLEIGTNHFGEVKYLTGIASPNIGIITNIGPSHLKYLKDLDGVFREKYDLIAGLKSPAVAILNADDKYLGKLLCRDDEKRFSIGIGIKNKSDFSASCLWHNSGKYRFKVNQGLEFALNVSGYYNIYNTLVAIAIGRIFGMGYRQISCALSGFKAQQGRLNIISKKGISFIDDTYNSNPLSLAQALGLLKEIRVKGRKIAIIGDMLELGKESKKLHIEAIKEAVKASDALITVGRVSKLSLKGLKLKKMNITSCLNSIQARDILLKDIKVDSKDIVLVKGSRRMKMEEVLSI